MKIKILISAVTFGVLMSGSVLACGGDSSGMHIGNVTHIDAKANRFTINDMESRKPITFSASADVIKAVKGANGRVTVNYEENDDGGLKATGVDF